MKVSGGYVIPLPVFLDTGNDAESRFIYSVYGTTERRGKAYGGLTQNTRHLLGRSS